MPEKYTIVFTYTGQREWTAGARSVNIRDCAISGDTDKTIGQVVSIGYRHYHASASSREWALTGGIMLDDGTRFYSNTVRKTIRSGESVAYVNQFTNLPTAEQVMRMAGIYTLDESGTPNSNGRLTWIADALHPLQLAIEFYDQPPTTYGPRISEFLVERMNNEGKPDPKGEKIHASIILSLADWNAPIQNARLTLHVSTKPDVVERSIDLASAIAGGIEGEIEFTLSDDYSIGSTWYFTLEFSIGSETALASAQAFRAKAPIHITNNGTAFGGYSSATAENPKEEFHNPVEFHNGFTVDGGLGNIGIQSGTIQLMVNANEYSNPEARVAFDRRYASPPVVTAVIDSSDNSPNVVGGLSLTVGYIDASGFTPLVYNGSNSSAIVSVNWIAVGTLA